MKKNLFIILSLFAISLAGCTSSNNHVTNIDSQEGEQSFNTQVEDFQYIKDFEDFISYNVLSITEDKPYYSDLSFSAKFDEKSSLQGGVDFSQKKISKNHDLATSDIEFMLKAENPENDSAPFDVSGSTTLLFKDNEIYANLHSLDVFMGEGNAVGKMYTLLGNMVIDKRVDLEVHSGKGIVVIDEDEDKRLPYIVGNFKNVLKTEDIESSPNFLNSVAEIIDTINWQINLGISTNELTMLSHEISYAELSDNVIQKQFTGLFQGKESAFELSFIASKKGIEMHIYNMKEYDTDTANYKDMDTEFIISLKEDKKSEYSVDFESIKAQQKVVDLEGEIKYNDAVKYSADFVIEPLELLEGQKISGKLEGNITKKSGESDREIPEITEEVILFTELLSL